MTKDKIILEDYKFGDYIVELELKHKSLARILDISIYAFEIPSNILNEHEYTIRISEDFHKRISINWTLANIDITSINNGFLAIKDKDNEIIDCSSELSKCNINCLLYNKCNYCIMKKLNI